MSDKQKTILYLIIAVSLMIISSITVYDFVTTNSNNSKQYCELLQKSKKEAVQREQIKVNQYLSVLLAQK